MQAISFLRLIGTGFIVVLALFLPAGCADGGRSVPDALSVLTWNVEALFDGQDDGNEYAEYRAAQGWNEEKYRSRLTAIGKAFGQIEGGPPDAAVFIELENEAVLGLLAEEYLSQYGYHRAILPKRMASLWVPVS